MTYNYCNINQYPLCNCSITLFVIKKLFPYPLLFFTEKNTYAIKLTRYLKKCMHYYYYPMHNVGTIMILSKPFIKYQNVLDLITFGTI